VWAAENDPLQWLRYDQSGDIAALSSHENPSMRGYKLLNSRVSDKNDLWAPFEIELAGFSAAQYQSLKPLILDRSVAEIQAAVAAGSLTYESLTIFYIYRIREIETDDRRFINAIISLNPEAVSRARMLDQRRQQGRVVSGDSVFGIPVLLKDNIGFSEMPTTAGALALRNNQTANAFVVQRLMDNGAVILGKANLSEWAYFFCRQCPSGYSALGGQTLNPYGRLQFGTGGSSSGSGASMAANLASLAVGSETSGSILSPASANSVVGLKPTTGSLSRTGVVPISATLDTTGPLVRSVADAVVLFNAMAGFDKNDTAMPLLSEDFRLVYRETELAAFRLGIVDDYADNEFYSAAASLLSKAGAELIEVRFSATRSDRFSEFLGAEMVRDLAMYLQQHASDAVTIGSIVDLQLFNQAEFDLRAPYGQALVDMMADIELTADELELLREELQSLATAELEQLFRDNDIDVLLSINNRHASTAALANYPALTIPMAYEDDGRPIGLTLIAPSFRDQDLIDVGAHFERLSRARRMPVDYQ